MNSSNAARSSWTLWALRYGLPCAAVALGSVWLIEPSTPATTGVVIGLAIAALFVFCLTMPRHRGSRGDGTP
ncbi:hypothetical protein ABZ313_23880 [Streptomyces sp. NPDC006251]|uniref:hypothetical protein n=1 Tax=Streptomyces sp. NPDC006251 TaxID=3155718 RepID=UPI0033B04844